MGVGEQRRSLGRYRRVSQQKKFCLLNLISKQKLSLRQAAMKVGVNYLTAKTIVFFNKNKYSSYQFNLTRPQASSRKSSNCLTAQITSIRHINNIHSKIDKSKFIIQIISSIGNKYSLHGSCNTPQNSILGPHHHFDSTKQKFPLQ